MHSTPSQQQISKNTQGRNANVSAGFTLIELIVSIGIFSVVLLVSVGALLSILGVNERVRSMEQVMNSLHFTLDSMARQIRIGTTYHCGFSFFVPYDEPMDCDDGETVFAFEKFDGDPDSGGDQVVYRLFGNTLRRSIDGGQNFSDATPEHVVVEELSFFAGGTDPTDSEQPYVLLIIKGHVSLRQDKQVDFNLETFVAQRNIDVENEE